MKGKTAIKEAKTGLREMMSPTEKPDEHEKGEHADAKADPPSEHIENGENVAVGEQHHEQHSKMETPDPKRADTAPAHHTQHDSTSKEGRKHEGLRASLMRKLHIRERKP